MKIENLVLLGLGGVALLGLLGRGAGAEAEPATATAQEEKIWKTLPVEDLPANRLEAIIAAAGPRVHDVAVVPAGAEARININCPFPKCEVLDSGKVVATLNSGASWSMCYYENARYGFANCCEIGTVRNAEGTAIGCSQDKMIQNTGVQNIAHVFQIREVVEEKLYFIH